MSHDDRCEADWNDGVCACSERTENRNTPWHVNFDTPKRTTLLRRIFR